MKISFNAELPEYYSSVFLLPPLSAFRPTPFFLPPPLAHRFPPILKLERKQQ
jgi:hypothetical protein